MDHAAGNKKEPVTKGKAEICALFFYATKTPGRSHSPVRGYHLCC
jgi:hypothetical protein